MPLISVIVSCYNQAQYLDECLQSVLGQTFQDWECIIVNDGSPDHTEEIAKRWVDKDARFKYFYQENKGTAAAKNLGISHAGGDFIQFLDCDDFIHKEKFKICINELEDQSINLLINNYQNLIDGIFTDGYYDLSKITFTYKTILLDWDIKFTIPIHCVILKKELIHHIKFNENLNAREDWVFWLEVFSKKPSIKFIPQILCTYRKNPQGVTKNFKIMLLNQIQAFRIIYDSIPEDLKTEFVNKILKTYEMFIDETVKMIDAKDKDFNILINSRSYKIGNSFLKPFKFLLKKE